MAQDASGTSSFVRRCKTGLRDRLAAAGALALTAALVAAGQAHAADEEPPAQEIAPAPTPSVPASPATETPPPPPAPPPSFAVTPPPVAATASPGPTQGYDPKAFSAGAWIRIGGRVQNPSAPDRLNDFYLDQVYVIVSSRGQMTDWLKWQINLNANVPATQVNGAAPLSYPSVGVQDLIAKIEPTPFFNVWVGRMLVAVDRSNLSGPWFINFWLYPGFFGNRAGPPIGLKSGPNGRDQGVTAWGQIGGGMFKYYLAAFNLDARASEVSPLYSGRLNLDLLDPEPGYYHESSYHGDKDIVAIGAGFQYQKNGSFTVVTPAMGTTPAVLNVGNYHLIEGDVLIDKRLGAMGVATLEGNAYFYDERMPVRRYFSVNGGYVFPWAVGPGRLAPYVRYQFTQETAYKQIDGYIEYLIKSHFAKFFAGYFYTDLGAGVTNKAVQFGVQLIRL
jgi:hypothetical protein